MKQVMGQETRQAAKATKAVLMLLAACHRGKYHSAFTIRQVIPKGTVAKEKKELIESKAAY